ncbi:MAG: DNA polymerase III subunit alpha, partial [Planctomycetes bacterium]|nr:DNA polymerase III subunit alpha [Planctomycetota bacterium]
RVEVDFSNRYYPVFVPAALQGASYTDSERQLMAEQFLRALCHDNIQHRYDARRLEKVAENYPGQDPLAVVKQRLGYELEIIISKGMCDYILIVYDFINWAKGRRIPVGPGRGSGAGSIVLYLIGVTDIEPLRFHLFFERFINPERISYPDIDVDICMDRRQEVIDYTIRKYGHDKVAQIITFGTMKAKMAIKDVGRVLNVPIAKVNEIAKAVPDDLAMTLEKALAIDPDFKDFYENDEEAKAIIDFAIQVEGSVRNTGIHAAGIIISGEPLMEKIPVCTSKDSPMLVTQYSMKPVEAVGMLKIDFLGLKTLTSIQKTVDAVNRRLEAPLDWVNLELDNTTAFELLNQGKTSGVFQLESSGMQELAKQLHIDKFEEIIAVGALYRPGPMEMIPSFINRKHGREEIENDHPLMKDILKETYGIIVYQEQVMQIAQVLAGYSLGEGDMLRRAMGKKDKAEMARQGEKFRKGAQAFGIDESKAMAIF